MGSHYVAANPVNTLVVSWLWMLALAWVTSQNLGQRTEVSVGSSLLSNFLDQGGGFKIVKEKKENKPKLEPAHLVIKSK